MRIFWWIGFEIDINIKVTRLYIQYKKNRVKISVWVVLKTVYFFFPNLNEHSEFTTLLTKWRYNIKYAHLECDNEEPILKIIKLLSLKSIQIVRIKSLFNFLVFMNLIKKCLRTISGSDFIWFLNPKCFILSHYLKCIIW